MIFFSASHSTAPDQKMTFADERRTNDQIVDLLTYCKPAGDIGISASREGPEIYNTDEAESRS
jgi:hypothetical protein